MPDCYPISPAKYEPFDPFINPSIILLFINMLVFVEAIEAIDPKYVLLYKSYDMLEQLIIIEEFNNI